LFQDASRAPARPEDGATWARAFEVDFPFGIDPEFAMGVHRVQGDNPDQLWPVIDERLEEE
jgi:hypothetical protein